MLVRRNIARKEIREMMHPQMSLINLDRRNGCHDQSHYSPASGRTCR